ncbi:MAG: TetR family transcriptional regulator [Acidimicrobiales bacterium]|nr:TetR family transcriptional regulator [Acidimicrobiales bacterium]
MSRNDAPPQPVETMSAAQLERRQRVLDAVVELVAAGRLGDMGMKDIADRSGVALGTIYRYFSSRDHVAAAALLEWARTLDGGQATGVEAGAGGRAVGDAEAVAGPAGTGGGGGGTMTDRLVAILHRAVRAYERQPSFARLLILAAMSTDPHASEAFAQMGGTVYDTLGSALDGLDPGERRRVLDVVGAVWYQAMIEWVNERKSIDEVYDSVESAARLVLAGFEPAT